MRQICEAKWKFQAEHGISVLEILISIVLLTIMAMGVTKGVNSALKTTKYTEYNHISSSLAVSRMEQLASVSINFLDASYGGTENAVTWPGSNETFTRVTTVTVNADDSRTITVTVTPNNTNLASTVEFTNTFANWE